MARVHVQSLGTLENKYLSQLHKPLVIVIDMVKGFVYEGALHDAAIADIAAPIRQLLDSGISRIFFADCHTDSAVEFASYPKHCVKGTSESEIIEELKPYAERILEKNSTNGFISAGWQDFLKESLSDYEDIIVTGCCTDICVMQFALCMRTWLNDQNRSGRVIIPVDMVDTYHIDDIHDVNACNLFALNNMKMNGIELCKTVEKGL